MNKMMQQAQELQKEFENITIKGSAGAEAVTVTLNGKGALININIDTSLFEKHEKDIIEDLIVAAHAQAKKELDAAMQEQMKNLTGGFNFPKDIV